jgi:hypothetical protein
MSARDAGFKRGTLAQQQTKGERAMARVVCGYEGGGSGSHTFHRTSEPASPLPGLLRLRQTLLLVFPLPSSPPLPFLRLPPPPPHTHTPQGPQV